MENKISIDLSGRVAVVTAGANGLGEGFVRSLARSGAKVVIADIDIKKGAELAGEINAGGGTAIFVETDMMACEQIVAMMARAADEFGRIDILVNNCGGVKKRLFVESFERSWRKHIDINLVSMLCASHEALKTMIDGGRGGTIINMSSVEGLRGCPGMAVYAACKAAMINFTKTLAVEVADYGIRVFALAPDMIETEGARAMLPKAQEVDAARERYVPLRRMGHPGEVGDIAAFLCTPMAEYMTGLTLTIDGGAMAAAGFRRTLEGQDWSLLS
jgi:NAD(P)-dependent dehydrogenase (short-subunit alcohol dehydrogenase family)